MLRPQRSGAIGMGPRAAMTAAGLDGMSYNDRAQWFESARLDALLGSNKTSLRSFKSGVSCFISFIGQYSVGQLAYSVIMLNTDLHKPQLKKNTQLVQTILLISLKAYKQSHGGHLAHCAEAQYAYCSILSVAAH